MYKLHDKNRTVHIEINDCKNKSGKETIFINACVQMVNLALNYKQHCKWM